MTAHAVLSKNGQDIAAEVDRWRSLGTPWQDSEELRELPLIGRDARLSQACMLHACLFTQDH